MEKVELDLHTHTLASGHAYGTMDEMAKAASKMGLKLLGITEHTKGIPGSCEDIYFANLKVVPRSMYGIDILLGAEINILNAQGQLDLSDHIMSQLDFRIAGIHSHCYQNGTMEENTSAMIHAIENPYVDMISHPDDGACPLDYEKVVLAAKKHHTILEVNNNSLRSSWRKNVKENVLKYLALCEHYEVPIVISSDAHHMADIANLDHVWPVLEEAKFPESLILNLSVERFRSFLAESRRLEKEAIAKQHTM